ncbi:MAG: hypothetical protein H0T72_09750 [Chloroflexia bacterium]|nr:hypothetical protein [Chloroflexia bacterium]
MPPTNVPATDIPGVEVPVTDAPTTAEPTVADSTGVVEVQVEYRNGPTAGIDGECGFSISLIDASGDVVSEGEACDGYGVTQVSPGAYVLRLGYGSYGSKFYLPSVPLMVESGETVSHIFDVSNAMGIVSGTVTVNGQTPAADQYLICVLTNGETCQFVGGDGRFGLLTAAGSGSADVRNLQGDQLGSRSVDVVAGETFQLDAAVLEDADATVVSETETVLETGTAIPLAATATEVSSSATFESPTAISVPPTATTVPLTATNTPFSTIDIDEKRLEVLRCSWNISASRSSVLIPSAVSSKRH